MSVHGLGSYYMTAHGQKRARRLDHERCGRWYTGSPLPDRYDPVERTVELAVRTTAVNAVQADWQRAPPKKMPRPLPTKRKIHRRGNRKVCQTVPPQIWLPKQDESQNRLECVWRSLCGRFLCGTQEDPAVAAVFMRVHSSCVKPCPRCDTHRWGQCLECRPSCVAFLEGHWEESSVDPETLDSIGRQGGLRGLSGVCTFREHRTHRVLHIPCAFLCSELCSKLKRVNARTWCAGLRATKSALDQHQLYARLLHL